jgi:hypothetical protein
MQYLTSGQEEFSNAAGERAPHELEGLSEHGPGVPLADGVTPSSGLSVVLVLHHREVELSAAVTISQVVVHRIGPMRLWPWNRASAPALTDPFALVALGAPLAHPCDVGDQSYTRAGGAAISTVTWPGLGLA